MVESYVLGLATEAERQAFEDACAAYPEVAEARETFERSLEGALLQDAVSPPAFLKEQVLLQVRPSETDSAYGENAEETKVRRINPWKWVAAACLVLLAGIAYWAYTMQKKYTNLLNTQTATQEQLQQTTAQLQALQQDADMLRKPGMKMVSLKGTEMAPQAQSTVFWDTTGTNRDVYLLVNNLPQPPSDKQYQLWALLDGKPIDLGLFDFEIKQQRLLVKMKNVQNAEAFAITLEQRGRANTAVPEGKIYVAGNL